MNVTYQSVFDFGLEPTAALLTQGFSGYFVPIQIPVTGLLGMVRQDSVDVTASRVILHDARPVGVALIARRGWTSRLAAMSIIPDARGQGIGAVAVADLLAEARERGDHAMTLEVIEQNTPAVRLYEKSGFQKIRRLLGFIGQPNVQAADDSLHQVDVREVAGALTAYGPDDLPWQLSGETLAQAGPPGIAFRSNTAWIALANPDAATVIIRAIVTLPEARRRGAATALVCRVMAQYPGKTWRVTPTFPEEFAGLYEKIGLERDTLAQWQMIAVLTR